MPRAYIFIDPENGEEDNVMDKLENTPGVSEYVKESTLVYGVYGIVALLEADTMDKLKEVAAWKIRRLKGIKSTLTTVLEKGYYLDEKDNPVDGFRPLPDAKKK